VAWLLHAGIGGLLSAPIVFFGRKRVHWKLWELAAFVLPYCTWMVLLFLGATPSKTLANLVEPLLIGAVIPLAALVRALIGVRITESLSAGTLVGVLCGIAAGLAMFTPPLPE
jgi:uncharacterized membrane protein